MTFGFTLLMVQWFKRNCDRKFSWWITLLCANHLPFTCIKVNLCNSLEIPHNCADAALIHSAVSRDNNLHVQHWTHTHTTWDANKKRHAPHAQGVVLSTRAHITNRPCAHTVHKQWLWWAGRKRSLSGHKYVQRQDIQLAMPSPAEASLIASPTPCTLPPCKSCRRATHTGRSMALHMCTQSTDMKYTHGEGCGGVKEGMYYKMKMTSQFNWGSCKHIHPSCGDALCCWAAACNQTSSLEMGGGPSSNGTLRCLLKRFHWFEVISMSM